MLRRLSRLSQKTTQSSTNDSPVTFGGRPIARIPTLDGYKRPERAPLPENLRREQFHQFMMGKQDKYPIELKTYVLAFALFSWIVGLAAFTFHKLKPDDFAWVEEQRNKAEIYKEKMLKKQADEQTVTQTPSA